MNYLETAIEAARAGGTVLLEKLGKVGYKEKNPRDLVTEADVESQKIIAEILLANHPDHCFIGEEKTGLKQLKEEECGSGSPRDFPYTWIVDPLDGTTNFVHQVPIFAVSIGLARGTEIVCGVIFNPVLNECFTAAKGQGAHLNGKPIHTSSIVNPKESLISFSFSPGVTENATEYQGFRKILPHNQALRRTGSTAINLAWMAAGRLDAVYCNSAHPWDVAAGVLMIEEAGGVVSSPDGTPFDLARSSIFAAATGDLHQKMIALLKE